MIPIILMYLLQTCLCQSPEVTYLLNLDSQMECCDSESEEFVDVSGVTVARYNETIAYMYGDIKFLKDVGPDTMVELILQKEASGKYEVMATHEICDLCSEVMKGPESDYYSYMKYFGIPEECPFAAGDYPIKEFILDTDDLPLNSNTAGRYQAFMTMYQNPERDCKKNKEFMLCLTMKLLIELD
ncbi:uncharacterized protein LOC124641851 [Helicoverpa zea]|uniref:uncharacterized protein LOC124641851 n=1 Tax=Helicoverpa zea TaxID=7113 RepID=UPI001F55B8B8|nr:uncharacterized protein LOC124641851 [Helicoverpa zea]